MWDSGNIPAEYILQCMHYMAITGAKKTYIAALVGGNHFVWHLIERDEVMIAKIIAMEKHFWEIHVERGVEPIPDGSDATTSYFNEKFCQSNGEIIELPEEALAVCEEYERISEQLKELEVAKNAAANQLKLYLKEAEAGIVGERRIIWKQVFKNSLAAFFLEAFDLSKKAFKFLSKGFIPLTTK